MRVTLLFLQCIACLSSTKKGGGGQLPLLPPPPPNPPLTWQKMNRNSINLKNYVITQGRSQGGSLGSKEPPQDKEGCTKRSTTMYKKVHYYSQ